MPVPTYAIGTLSPAAVSLGSNVPFQVGVSLAPGMARVALNRTGTIFTLSDGLTTVNAILSTSSPLVLEGGTTKILRFESVNILPAFSTLNPLTPSVELTGNYYGIPLNPTLTTAPDQVTIQEAAGIEIVSIDVSAPGVTAGQTTDWYVAMAVSNNGGSRA